MITCTIMTISFFLFTEQQYRESLDHQGLGNRGIIVSGIWSLKAEGKKTS